MIYNGKPLIFFLRYIIMRVEALIMKKDVLKCYAEQLATNTEKLCRKLYASSNTIFQLRKSSSSVYANISEAGYAQSRADMISKFEIALKECIETEAWLQLLYNTESLDRETFRVYRNLCGRIRRILIKSCITLKENKK